MNNANSDSHQRQKISKWKLSRFIFSPCRLFLLFVWQPCATLVLQCSNSHCLGIV